MAQTINLSTGVDTFGNSTVTSLPITGISADMPVVKTLINGQWNSWSAGAPDAYQGMLNIEPGRGYVAVTNANVTFNLPGADVDINTLPIQTGLNMLAVPGTPVLGAGYIPRMQFTSAKAINGTWKSWTAGAAQGFQGFLSALPEEGYIFDVSNVFGNVVDTNNVAEGIEIDTGDATIDNTGPVSGMLLTAPGMDHVIKFNTVTYDPALPTNIMFYDVNGEIGKIDYPSELENTVMTITAGGVSYTASFIDGSTYVAPEVVILGNGITMTKTTKTVATGTVYSVMLLDLDGKIFKVNVAAEYIGDTFQLWKDGNMITAVFAAGTVTATFV